MIGIVSAILAIGFTTAVMMFWGTKISLPRAIAFGLALLIPYALTATVIGSPQPSWLNWGADRYTLLSAHFVENEAIYLWLLPDGSTQPVYKEVPWSESDANEVIESLSEVESEGGLVKLQMDGTPNGTIEAWPEPYPANPPKGEAL